MTICSGQAQSSESLHSLGAVAVLVMLHLQLFCRFRLLQANRKHDHTTAIVKGKPAAALEQTGI